MRFELSSVFKFLPSEVVKASELKRGDVALLHTRWDLVIDTKRDENYPNNGWDQQIHLMGGSGSYLPPEHNVTIVKRDLFDSAQMQKFILELLEEERRLEELARIEEEEDREREKEDLRYRLRKLGD